MTCHACDEGRCAETFTCRVCGRELNTCRDLVGGFDHPGLECVHCFELRMFGPDWAPAWRQTLRNVSNHEGIERIVEAAVAYRLAEEQ